MTAPAAVRPALVSSGNGATATAVATETRAAAALRALDGVDLGFLDWRTAEYDARVAQWARDEARQAGGDGVLRELVPWKGEDALSYASRRAQAKYLNFPQIQSLVLTGHLERARPMPGKGFSLDPLGDIEPIDQRAGRSPSDAELFWEGADGTGAGASPFPKVAAAEQKRACATGHRWTLVEMPSLADVRAQQGRPWAPGSRADTADVQAGFRPYLLTLSPRQVPYWKTVRGKLRAAICRIPVETDDDSLETAARNRGASSTATSTTAVTGTRLGYYLLVAEGYRGFGDAFAGGGWWLFDADQALVIEDGQPMTGTWDDTDGEIPMVALVAGEADAALDLPRGRVGAGTAGAAIPATAADGQPATGDATAYYAALYGAQYGTLAGALGLTASPDSQAGTLLPMSRSLTMELGQVAVNLMNRLSERDANFHAACKSILYVLGVDPSNPAAFNLTVAHVEAGGVLVPVPAWRDAGDGSGTTAGAMHVPSVWHSSAGLVDAQAADLIIQSCIAEAREIMVRQLTADSAAQQSGTSKQVEFATGASPMLSHMILGRSAWENNVLYYVCRRAGKAKAEAWQAYSKWPREVELRPIVDDIDAMLTTMLRSGTESATLAVSLVLQAAKERGLLQPEDEEKVKKELLASLIPPAPPALPGGAPANPGDAAQLAEDARLKAEGANLARARGANAAENTIGQPDATQVGQRAVPRPTANANGA